MRPDSVDLREFLNVCAAGDTDARQCFQETYGEDIYNFPVKIYGTPIEEAGDFYLYVFDKDRIFIRLKTSLRISKLSPGKLNPATSTRSVGGMKA